MMKNFKYGISIICVRFSSYLGGFLQLGLTVISYTSMLCTHCQITILPDNPIQDVPGEPLLCFPLLLMWENKK